MNLNRANEAENFAPYSTSYWPWIKVSRHSSSFIVKIVNSNKSKSLQIEPFYQP